MAVEPTARVGNDVAEAPGLVVEVDIADFGHRFVIDENLAGQDVFHFL
jgi:hypothetical protein